MARLWCKTLRHLFPQEPEDDEPTHDQVVSEAQLAASIGEQQLAEVDRLSARMERASNHSRQVRNRNHFSELVAAMLKEEK